METKKYGPWLRYLGLTGQLLALIGISLYAGIRLDNQFNFSPLLTVSLPLLILAFTFYKLIRETGKKNPKNGNKK